MSGREIWTCWIRDLHLTGWKHVCLLDLVPLVLDRHFPAFNGHLCSIGTYKLIFAVCVIRSNMYFASSLRRCRSTYIWPIRRLAVWTSQWAKRCFILPDTGLVLITDHRMDGRLGRPGREIQTRWYLESGAHDNGHYLRLRCTRR